MTSALVMLAVTFLLLPLLFTALDAVPGMRAKRIRSPEGEMLPEDDFEILVPIYGSVAYLENVEYLSGYADKVVLCTTDAETPEFNSDLDLVATSHGFRIFRGHVSAGPGGGGRRNTGGTIRDRLVRDALAVVSAGNVVCIDADTVSQRSLAELVGEMVARDFDIVSVCLVPANSTGVLARLQAHEYRLAMSLRRLAPWLLSGACHAARTNVLRTIMNRHSLFFQGNDVETGVIGDALGFRVGHIPFEVQTTVPAAVRPWLRQRLAWSGGEFRLFIVNIRLMWRHPLLWLYGSVVVIVGAPLRWLSASNFGASLAFVACLYLFLTVYLNWHARDRWLALMPLYMAFSSLILTPLGLIAYLTMTASSRNAGIIRARPSPDVAVVR